MVNSKLTAALLYSLATPLEIWAALELAKADYSWGCILLAAGMVVTFFGIHSWISAQSIDVKRVGHS